MRAKRVDENQSAIVNVLRQIPGCVVTDLSGCGEGVPDLAISFRGKIYWFEIKNPNLRWQLKPAQVKFHAEQKNVANVDVHIVTTVKQALEILGLNSL